MRKFRKLVAIEPIKMIPEAIDSLGRYADEVIIHSDMPQTADETAARIGDADAALVSIIRKTKRFAIPERAVYFLKTKRTAGGTPPPQNIFDRLTPVFT